jgi:hypothetical protein
MPLAWMYVYLYAGVYKYKQASVHEDLLACLLAYKSAYFLAIPFPWVHAYLHVRKHLLVHADHAWLQVVDIATLKRTPLF